MSNKKKKNRNQSRQRRTQGIPTNKLFIGIGFYLVLIIIAINGSISWMVVGWYVAMGLVTFLVYAKDKRAAEHRKWRTPESTLHILSMVGGWVGAMIAQNKLRHKIHKSSFQLVYHLTVVVNLALLLFIIAKG